MDDRKGFNIDFGEFGDGEDISGSSYRYTEAGNYKDKEYGDISSSSASHRNDRYEDIVSDSSSVKTGSSGSVNFTSFASYEDDDYYYAKKKHGLSKKLNNFYYKMKKWWKCMGKGKKAALISFTSFLLVIAIALTWFFSNFSYNYRNITKNPEELGFDEPISEEVINIGLFGIDTRDENSFKGNSDSIMILSINTKTKKIKIISIMRDTLVPIDKNGKTTYYKINAAYSWGGPELAIKTLNQNFGLDIAEYATVNFYGMSGIIDAVGGIDATLTEQEVKARGNNNHGINDMIQEVCSYMGENPKDYYITTSGTQHLNGIQAVAYSRIRYVKNIWGTNNDYGRTDRQRYVMEQLFNKAKSLSKSDCIKLAKAMIPCTETSLSYSEIINIAFNVLFSSPTFEQARIPVTDNGINMQMTSPTGSFGSVVYYDLDYAAKLIHAFIYDDVTFDKYIEENPVEKNDWYAKATGSSSASSKPSSSSSSSSTDSESSTASSKPSSSSSSTSNSNSNSDSDSSTQKPEEPSTPTKPESPDESAPTTPEEPDGPDSSDTEPDEGED